MTLFESYIEKHGRRLYGLCLSLIGQDADDLYQETWLRAYMKLGSYKPELPFEAWLTSICVNAYRDEVRKRRRRIAHEIDTEEKQEMIEAIADTEDAYSVLELREAVESLPTKLREAVVLYYYCGHDEKTTASMLKIPVGTVKSRLNAAKIKLKGVLTNEEF